VSDEDEGEDESFAEWWAGHVWRVAEGWECFQCSTKFAHRRAGYLCDECHSRMSELGKLDWLRSMAGWQDLMRAVESRRAS